MAQCRFCGGTARLDLFCRWIIACAIALVLPAILLYGGLFYSGHLFLISMFVIFGGGAALSGVGFPLLTLEKVPEGSPLERSHAILLVLILLVAATILDGFMASRFDLSEAAP